MTEYYGNALDGDFIYLVITSTQSQANNQSTVSWAIWWAFRQPSPTDREIRNGAGAINNVVVWDDGGVVHPNRAQYYEHEEMLKSGTQVITHNASGDASLTMWAEAYPYYGSNYNTRSYVSVTIALPHINRNPAAVATVTLSNPTPTGMKVTWVAPASNGSAITGYDVKYSTQSTMAGAVTKTVGNVLTTDLTGLIPLTSYYVTVSAKNAVGTGPASAPPKLLATLPSGPPGISIAPSASGTAATLTFTPPGGVTGVNSWTWERRDPGDTVGDFIDTTLTSTVTATGLTPGNVYEWRVKALIGTYTTEYSAWTPATQPKPNTSPGDYFDGDTQTPASGDIDYSWSVPASPHASTSIATAMMPEGWEIELVGGAGYIMRATAGIFSDHSARGVITQDTTGAGSRFGQRDEANYWSDATPGVVYVGSLYVRPTRAQSLAAEITWLTTAGAVVSRTVGAATNVPGGSWLRLAVGGTAPATAEWAVVRATDVAGAGWSVWLGGDSIDMDGAMLTLNEELPYFDGSTLVDGEFVYEWVDTTKPHASTSKRTPISQVDSAAFAALAGSPLAPGAWALQDPACIPPRPPRPPIVQSACITEAGIWRRVLGEIPAADVAEYLDVVPTFEIVTLTKNVSQVRIRVYPNPTGVPANQVNLKSGWISEQIISYVPANTVLTIDGVHERVFAEIAGGDPVAADHLLYGTNGTPATWPILSCGSDYVITADLPVEILQEDSKLYTYLTTRY